MRSLIEFRRPASALVFKEDSSDYKNGNTLGVLLRKGANWDINSK